MDPEAELKQAAACWTLNDLTGCFAHLNAYRQWREGGGYSPDFELTGWTSPAGGGRWNPKRPSIYEGDELYRELLLNVLGRMPPSWDE